MVFERSHIIELSKMKISKKSQPKENKLDVEVDSITLLDWVTSCMGDPQRVIQEITYETSILDTIQKPCKMHIMIEVIKN